MNVIGYAIIKKDAKTGTTAGVLDNFLGKIVRVIEFAIDGGCLCIDRQATGLATFDKCDIKSYFKCSVYGGQYICPPGKSILEDMAYATKCSLRKGGYDNIVREMVIMSSLHRGEFNDDFLWRNS